MEDLPKPAWSGAFTVFGVEVRCHVLDDGSRIVERESLAALLNAIPGGDRQLGSNEMDDLARWIHTGQLPEGQ